MSMSKEEFMANDAKGAVAVPQFDEAETRRVMRKVDWHVLPILCGFYFFQAIIPGNIAFSALGGIRRDTDTADGAAFNLAVAMFFAGGIVATIPTTLMLQRVAPRIWVPLIVFGMGASNVMMGFAKGRLLLYFGRFLLGVFEAGILPASLLITGYWYPKKDHSTKIAIWYSMGSIGSAFGGVMAFG
ncbi:hypothetical protein HDV05_004463, partial [Chytridiales sp. JEL 0842]